MNSPYYLQTIEAEFQRRKAKNPAYSLRAFAAFLDLAPTPLSEILRGLRSLPAQKGEAVAERLKLSRKERERFLSSVRLAKANLNMLTSMDRSPRERHVLDEKDHGRFLSEWEYYAVITLLETKSRYATASQVAGRLGLTEERAQQVLEDLLNEKFIEKVDGFFQKSVGPLDSTAGVPSAALRERNRKLALMAAEKIETVPMKDRYYSASTVAIDPTRLEEFRKIYREFRQKAAALLEAGEPTEVYQICLQVFPLTEPEDSP